MRWEDRGHLVELGPPDLLGAWVGEEVSVQRYAVEGLEGWDHLHVQRHDGAPIRSWAELQAIKDELAPDGPERLAVEVYPPAERVVDTANAYHLWVLPRGYASPLDDLHDELGHAGGGRTYTPTQPSPRELELNVLNLARTVRERSEGNPTRWAEGQTLGQAVLNLVDALDELDAAIPPELTEAER